MTNTIIQAIAICRVSTHEQRDNNSLDRQEESVQNAAQRLGVEIIRTWSGDASSKVGKNVKRKDLNEAFAFCKANRRVKYLIVDEVDRFMRSTGEMFYWMTKFDQEAGVVVHFASNPDHNTADAKARLLLSLEGFKAEGSNEERQHKSISGHEKAIREGRYTFYPKPGYMKGYEPGVHIPNPITHDVLKQAFKSVLSGVYTPKEALKVLNDSSFNEVHSTWKMDKFRKFAIDPYYAGILIKDKQVKARNEAGQHTAMISLEEHEELVRIFNGTLQLRGHKKQYNPEFPMNKIMTCEDCGDEMKFTGSKKNNGYSKTKTRYYYKYHCRGCNKGYHRDDVHHAVTKQLNEVTYTDNQRKEFIEALCIVWSQKQKDKLSHAKALESKIIQLEDTKSKLVLEMVRSDSAYKEDIRIEVDRVKEQISAVHDELHSLDDLHEDLIDFVKFGLEYTNELKDDWWSLTHEERVRCQQLIFPGGISFNSDKKVGTRLLSPIYSFQANKKDLRIDRKSLMVELAGTAPASAGLSWLVFYRLRLFGNLSGHDG
jgi:site-specific DNA recombinase